MKPNDSPANSDFSGLKPSTTQPKETDNKGDLTPLPENQPRQPMLQILF